MKETFLKPNIQLFAEGDADPDNGGSHIVKIKPKNVKEFQNTALTTITREHTESEQRYGGKRRRKQRKALMKLLQNPKNLL